METGNVNKNISPSTEERESTPCQSHSGRVVAGLLIVTVGSLLLARKAGLEYPSWLLSFETVLIGLGIYLGFRHSFRGFAWLIPILIGSFLLVDDFYPYYDIGEFFWPIIIIGLGLFIMFRPAKKKRDWGKWNHPQAYTGDSQEDYLDSTVVFGGIKKNIISKDFKGGETVTVFGGTEINLMQADINGTIVLELTQIFGGTKLIVPPHWKVHTKDLVAIFGGVDDKRPMMSRPAEEETNKVLVLKGTCLLGGIEIRSY